MLLYCNGLWLCLVRRQRDDEAGEVPVAFVVRRAGAATSESELLKFIASQVGVQYSTLVSKEHNTGLVPCS